MLTATIPAPRLPAAQIADAHRADITRLLPALGKRWAHTSGGEYHTACPKCGGTDRLLVWPYHPRGPRLACRQCHNFDIEGKTLDAIAVVRWLTGASFPQAVAVLTGGALPPLPTPPPAAPRPPAPYRPPAAGQRITAVYDSWMWDARVPGADLIWQHCYRKERREPGPRGQAKTFYICHLAPGAPAPAYAPGGPVPAITPTHWRAGRGPSLPWPYNLREAWQTPPGTPLFWVDGEKDVETARAAGLIAVCGPDGGGSWHEEWAPLFYEHPALLIPDSTPEGPGQAERAARLIGIAADYLKIIPLPAKDLTAWLEAGCNLTGARHAA